MMQFNGHGGHGWMVGLVDLSSLFNLKNPMILLGTLLVVQK